MNRKHFNATATILLATILFTTPAWAVLKKTGVSSTSFSASGSGGLSVVGKTSDMTIADDGTTITITVPLANLKTGLALRDQKTLQALEASKFPAVVLSVPRSKLKFPSSGSKTNGTAQGQFTLHGVTKTVSLHYTAQAQGATDTIKGSLKINFTEFDIMAPNYLGVTVKPEVSINTSFQVSGH